MNPTLAYLISLQLPERQEAFVLGYNSVLDGANEENCHFSIFTLEENTKAWEAGAAEAKRFMATVEDKSK